MRRGIYLGDNLDSPLYPVVYHLHYVRARISHSRSESRVVRQVRIRVHLQRKRVVVRDVPVKRVHLVVHHRVQVLQQNLDRNEVSRGIDHHSPVRELRRVRDLNRHVHHLECPVLVRDCLREGLDRPHEPRVGLAVDIPRVVREKLQSVGVIVRELKGPVLDEDIESILDLGDSSLGNSLDLLREQLDCLGARGELRDGLGSIEDLLFVEVDELGDVGRDNLAGRVFSDLEIYLIGPIDDPGLVPLSGDSPGERPVGRDSGVNAGESE